MKQRITTNELSSLKNSQKEALRKFWMPMRHDIAVAYVCTDVENDIYAEVEFTIGRIKIRPSGNSLLYDLRAADGYQKIMTEEEQAEEVVEDPIVFTKDVCLPLLTIGQMIEILGGLNFNKYHFYLLAGNGKIGCEVGNFNSVLKGNILKEGYIHAELCDVLWDMLTKHL